MTARAFASLALLVVFVAGCQGGGGIAGQQLLGTLGSVAGFGPSGPTATPSDVRGAFGEMDEPEEVELGRSIAAAVGARYKVSRDRNLTKYVALVGNMVAATSDRPDIRYYFAVLDSDEINALAAPGGFVFVTRGALALMPDEAALAGVLGHEIGHIALRHHAESIKAAKQKNLAVMGLQQGLVVHARRRLLGTDRRHRGCARGAGHPQGAQPRGRDGVRQGRLSVRGPRGVRSRWAARVPRALAARGSKDAGVAKFFSTHPGTEDRLQEQTKMRQAWSGSGKREAARFAAAMGR